MIISEPAHTATTWGIEVIDVPTWSVIKVAIQKKKTNEHSNEELTYT